MKKEILIIIIVLLVLSIMILAFFNINMNNKLNNLETKMKNSNSSSIELVDEDDEVEDEEEDDDADEDADEDEDEDEEYELAVTMGRMQIYMNKLWFAGKGENWDLAGFYIHETEECMEEIESKNLKEEGVELSSAIKDWGLNPLSELEKSVKEKDSKLFLDKYTFMVANCNSCHVATQKSFIKISQPTTPVFTNQVYSIK